MESNSSDISKFVLVDKKKWQYHLKKLFGLKDDEIAYFEKECPDSPDCYYFTIYRKKEI